MKAILSSRRHHYVAIASIFLVTVALIAGMVSCIPPPIEIWDWYDLDAVRNNLGSSYILMNDLDSTTYGYDELASETANNATGWQPIGNDTNPFTGTFDGQGYEIGDLFINRPDEDYVGLFSYVDGVIQDVSMVNIIVTGDTCVGGLAGRISNGTVMNSYSFGNVTGYMNIGGLVGHITYGTVSNSYSSASVTSLGNAGGLVGGIQSGTVDNSYSTGSVNGTATIGGLVGHIFVNGTVSNSYSTGNVTGDSSCGGLVGEKNNGTISNSFWDIQTSGQATSDGGTGKNTTEMQAIATFSDVAWDIVAVGGPSERNPSYIWNIVNNVTYPFLSWQS